MASLKASLQLLSNMSFMVLPLTEGVTSNDEPPLLGGQSTATPPSPHLLPRMPRRSWGPIQCLIDTGFFMHKSLISLCQETAGKSRWALSKYKLMLTFAGIMYSLEPLHRWRQWRLMATWVYMHLSAKSEHHLHKSSTWELSHEICDSPWGTSGL